MVYFLLLGGIFKQAVVVLSSVNWTVLLSFLELIFVCLHVLAAVQMLSKTLKSKRCHLERPFMTGVRCNLLRNNFICSYIYHFLFVSSIVKIPIFASVCKDFTFAFIVPFNFWDFESSRFPEHFPLVLSLYHSFSLKLVGKRNY